MKKLIFLLLLSLSSQAWAGEYSIPDFIQDQYQIVKDLHDNWLLVDDKSKYVPYIEGDRSDDSPIIAVPLDLQRYSGNKLLCHTPAKTSILIGQQIVNYFDQESTIVLDIDSLQRVYHEDQLFVSMYNEAQQYDKMMFLIVKEGAGSSKIANKSLLRNSGNNAVKNFFIVGLLILLVSYAFQLNQYPKTFRVIYDLRKVFSFKVREETSKLRLINEPNIVFLAHHCLLVAYLMVLILATSNSLNLSSFIDTPETFWGFILIWIKMTLVVFGLIWLKYFMVMTLGTLFGLRNLRYIHVFDFMRMSLIFWSILFLIFTFAFSGIKVNSSTYSTVLIYLFVSLAILRVFVLYSRLFRSTSFRNLYLFSYICTSEVIPLLIGIELFIN